MARFDVYRMPGGRPGYVVDVQAHILRDMSTRVVVPLVPSDRLRIPLPGLNPAFEIGDASFVLLPQQIGAIPTRQLGKPVGSLASESDTISRALDYLLAGI